MHQAFTPSQLLYPIYFPFMILILSTSKYESTTEEAIRWLMYYQANWKRINGYDLQNEPISAQLDSFRLADNELSSTQFPVIWYRRWNEYDLFDEAVLEITSIRNKGEVRRHLREEFTTLSRWLWHRLRPSFWLTDPTQIDVNKLVVLDIARQSDLAAPVTMVFTRKTDLMQVMEHYGALITKAMGNGLDLDSLDGKVHYTLYTEEVRPEHLDDLPDTFAPTLFQQKIDKAYEIRIFYLDGHCYAMAIFSQRNAQTSVDFRHYDKQVPNRNVPYTLPKDVERKIRTLMKHLGLNRGSIDLMVEKGTKVHYFLEVNPVGQFGMVSAPCNYYLEKKVAVWLMAKHRLYENQKHIIQSSADALETSPELRISDNMFFPGCHQNSKPA